MIDTLLKSRNANTGVFYLRQIALSTLDLNLHTSDGAGNIAEACLVQAAGCR